MGRFLSLTKGSKRPILLKKYGLVLTTEKYASEIEFLAFSRGVQTRILRSSGQKMCFYPSIFERLRKPTFSTESAKSGRLNAQ